MVPLKVNSELFEKIFGDTTKDSILVKSDSDCSSKSNTLVGTWINFYFRSTLMSKDSVEEVIRLHEKKSTTAKTAPRNKLSFTEDSVTFSNGSAFMYDFNLMNCELRTFYPKEKGKRKQKIIFLSEKYFVLEDCLSDCFTMFYRRE